MTDWSVEKLERLSDHVEEEALYNRDQAASWQRWVMAACLSINGGAAIAVLNLAQIDANSRLWSIFWFVAGLLSSISFGFAASIMMNKFSGYYKLQGWQIANLAGQTGEGDKPRLDIETFDKLLNRDKDIFWIQFVGLACFTIGIIVAVEGLK